MAGESAYTEFAEWDGNPHKYSFGTYAKFNSRYAYNRLESITPSDDISSGKTVPNAELFCENHVETTAAEAWPIAERAITTIRRSARSERRSPAKLISSRPA